jgi:hypothetical protein
MTSEVMYLLSLRVTVSIILLFYLTYVGTLSASIQIPVVLRKLQTATIHHRQN